MCYGRTPGSGNPPFCATSRNPGHLRFLLERVRPELRQYFLESDLDWPPFNYRQRPIVYQRAKDGRQSVPFGILANNWEGGYEWLAHAMFPVTVGAKDLSGTIGGRQGQQLSTNFKGCFSVRNCTHCCANT